jgi:hypothetical protein
MDSATEEAHTDLQRGSPVQPCLDALSSAALSPLGHKLLPTSGFYIDSYPSFTVDFFFCVRKDGVMHPGKALFAPSIVGCIAISTGYGFAQDFVCDLEPSTGQSSVQKILDKAVDEAVCDWTANIYHHDQSDIERENFNNATSGYLDRTKPPAVDCAFSSDGYVVTIEPTYGCKHNMRLNRDEPLPRPYTQPGMPTRESCGASSAASKLPAASNPGADGVREASLAAINAKFAIITIDAGGEPPLPLNKAQKYLQKTINYLVGPKGRAYRDAGILCSLGNGAIADATDPSGSLQSASALAQQGLKERDLARVKADAQGALDLIKGTLEGARPQAAAKPDEKQK